MANDGNKIYIGATGVEIADLQQVLGRGVNDLGLLCSDQEWNAAGTALQPANKINPWALYKPVREPEIGMITRMDFGSLGFGNTSGANALPYATTINGFVSLYADGDNNNLGRTSRANGWRYLKPRGKAQSEMFRIFDFVKVISENGSLRPVNGIGYNHRAVNPFGKFDCVTSVTKNGGLFMARNTRTVPQTGVPEYDITIEDINATINSAYKMLYYGVMLVPEDNQSGVTTTYIIFNNNQTINEGNTGQDYIRGNERLYLNQFSLSDTMPIGFYTAYPFLTPSPLDSTTRYLVYLGTQRNTQLPARLYPLPGTTPLRVNIYNTELIINVFAPGRVETISGQYQGQIYITIKNNGTATANVPRLVLQFRTSDAEFDTTRRTGEVFYDGQYRIDDAYPTGRADSSYSAWLRPSGGYDIAGGGTEIRVPADTTMLLTVNIPSAQTSWIIVGDPTRTRVFGIAQFRMPVIPDANLIEEQ